MTTPEETPLSIALEALEKLSRLGNGDQPGNSECNLIARLALYKITDLETKIEGDEIKRLMLAIKR